MKIVGIVAEYNPFHNGHKLQIDYAKEVLGATHVIVATSGSFTQRGTVASFNKYARAEAALKNGADIVFEIPTIFATSSAKEFASCGVSLLYNTGICDELLFGAENDDIEEFKSTATRIIAAEKSKEFNQAIQQYLASGMTYAAARQLALGDSVNNELLESPNNILGLEYVKYVLENNIPIKLNCLKRMGSSYNDRNLTGIVSSATSIRQGLFDGKDISMAIPENVMEIINNNVFIHEDDISQLLHMKLLATDDFCDYLDCNQDISNKINNNKIKFTSFNEFAKTIKSRDIAYTRISRILSHILLGIKTSDFESAKKAGYVSYLRMLGFSKNGSELLGQIKDKSKFPLITTPNESVDKFDIISSDILRIIETNKTGIALPNEYTRKFNLVNL